MKAKLYDQIVTLVDLEVDFGQRLNEIPNRSKLRGI